MSDDALRAAISMVIDAANANSGREILPPFRDALNQLARLDGFDANQKRSYLARSLTDVKAPSGAGFIALWLGAGVEEGADPSPQTDALVNCLRRFATEFITDENDDEAAEVDDQLAIGLEFLGQGLVAHLSRDVAGLQALRSNADAIAELERIETHSPGPAWVMELVRRISGTLIVLHGQQRVGAKVSYRYVGNCFQLFTLLQAALAEQMPGARKASPEVLAVVRGEWNAEFSDEAWWHFGQPVPGEPSIATMVFGEMSPQSIMTIEGQQVLLLWPPILGNRAWDAGFLGPTLAAAPSAVEILQMLTLEEIAIWRQRIGLPDLESKKAVKSWWKFW